MSFLNFLHGKRRKALRKRRKELDKFLTEHDKLKLKLVNSTTQMKAQLILFLVKLG